LAENHFNVLHVNGHFLKIKQNAMRNLKRENPFEKIINTEINIPLN